MNELELKVQELEKKVTDLSALVSNYKELIDKQISLQFLDVNQKNIIEEICVDKLSLLRSEKISFNGITTGYDIYRVDEDGGSLRIDAQTDYGNEYIIIGDSKKPLGVNIWGGDEATIGANNNTNNSYLLVSPTSAGFYTNSTNTFKLRMPNLSSNPTSAVVGDLAVVSGKLMICTAIGPVVWTIVGTQT